MDDNKRNHTLKTFHCHDNQNTFGLQWKRWLELFADGKGLIVNQENAKNRQRQQASTWGNNSTVCNQTKAGSKTL